MVAASSSTFSRRGFWSEKASPVSLSLKVCSPGGTATEISLPREIGEGVAQGIARLDLLRLVLVLRARPEETAQAIFAAARHDVHVKMGNALADDVVERDERPLGAECRQHRACQQARAGEHR